MKLGLKKRFVFVFYLYNIYIFQSPFDLYVQQKTMYDCANMRLLLLQHNIEKRKRVALRDNSQVERCNTQ